MAELNDDRVIGTFGSLDAVSQVVEVSNLFSNVAHKDFDDLEKFLDNRFRAALAVAVTPTADAADTAADAAAVAAFRTTAIGWSKEQIKSAVAELKERLTEIADCPENPPLELKPESHLSRLSTLQGKILKYTGMMENFERIRTKTWSPSEEGLFAVFILVADLVKLYAARLYSSLQVAIHNFPEEHREGLLEYMAGLDKEANIARAFYDETDSKIEEARKVIYDERERDLGAFLVALGSGTDKGMLTEMEVKMLGTQHPLTAYFVGNAPPDIQSREAVTREEQATTRRRSNREAVEPDRQAEIRRQRNRGGIGGAQAADGGGAQAAGGGGGIDEPTNGVMGTLGKLSLLL